MNLLKKVIYTGVGAVAIASEKVSLSLQNLNESLEEKGKIKAEDCVQFLTEGADRVLSQLKPSDMSENESLIKKIEELELRLDMMEQHRLGVNETEVLKK